MSCKYPTEEDNIKKKAQSSQQIETCFGFLFAFYRFSHSEKKSLIEKFVSMATSSDYIHVGIIPVERAELYTSHYYTSSIKNDDSSIPINTNVNQVNKNITKHTTISKLYLQDKVYTAFIGYGFDVQKVSAVLNDTYEYIFYPVTEYYLFQKGIQFMESLKGSGYNYFILPFTIFPTSFKKSQDSETDHTCVVLNPNSPPQHNHETKKIICSHIGLSLLYTCDPTIPRLLEPKLCLPGELKNILLQSHNSIPCSSTTFTTIV